MKKGFYTIIVSQFLSSLADNALMIAALTQLQDIAVPHWMAPVLKEFFAIPYVLLAAFVGAFADSRPKGKVMLITNAIKFFGCATMLFGTHPLISYGMVGLGAAAYSPAKYGILTELLPPEKLVVANGWIEGTTVTSIILGFTLGSLLISPHAAVHVLRHTPQSIDTPARAAMFIILGIYAMAALVNLRIPDTGARYARQEHSPVRLVTDFAHCFVTLWKDKLGQISLAVTTLFWGAGAMLQLIVLDWAKQSLGLSMSQSSGLLAIVMVGAALGAVVSTMRVPLKKSLSVLPAGIAMGCTVMMMAFYSRALFPAGWGIHLGHHFYVPWYLLFAYLFLLIVGGLSGFFLVPMNALLQHRGHVLLSAGHSIAVQNFNENLSILVILGLYASLLKLEVPVNTIIVLFGVFLSVMMLLVMWWHRLNQRAFDSVALIGESPHRTS
jgi:LPLT family lysophospholipid transporter-like MFS transporter